MGWKSFNILISVVWSISSLLSVYSVKGEAEPSQKLILISFDGFRHDYLDLARTVGKDISAFEKIWNSGFRASKVDNEFVTKTGPNHFSIVTGQHEESHGFVDNAYFDPSLDQNFSFHSAAQSTDSKWFDSGGEPIWVTNNRHGHASAVTFWAGSFAKIKGVVPEYGYRAYSSLLPLKQRIDDLLNWMSHDEVTLGLLYYHEPDRQGHLFGAASAEVLNVIESLNRDLDYLLKELDRIEIFRNKVNVILTSDHGMSSVSSGNVLLLDQYISDKAYWTTATQTNAIWPLWPKQGYTAKMIYDQLVNKHANMKVMLKEEIPERLYYSNNVRIAPVIVYCDQGWTIAKSQAMADSTFSGRAIMGDHGYDPSFTDMNPLFLAMGPGFNVSNQRLTIDSIKMVDIYPMMCHLLGLQSPGPHNGSLDRVKFLLNPVKPVLSKPAKLFATRLDMLLVALILIFVILVGLTFSLCALLQCCQSRAAIRRRNRRANILDVPLRQLPRRAFNRHRRGGQSPDAQVLLEAVNLDNVDDYDDVNQYDADANQIDLLNKSTNHYVDDETLFKMLHGPRNKYP